MQSRTRPGVGIRTIVSCEVTYCLCMIEGDTLKELSEAKQCSEAMVNNANSRGLHEVQALIERVKRVNNSVQQLELVVDESLARIKPGQSLLARLNTQSWHPYLREHWWPVGIKPGNKLLIERPVTEQYTPGQVISVLGLIGQPYRFRRNVRNVMLLAYDTPPTPLMMTVPWLLSNNVNVTLVLLGSAAKYETAHIPPEIEIMRGGEDPAHPLSWDNQVMAVGLADQVFVVVNPESQMERLRQVVRRFEELRARLPQYYIFGVLHPVVACGAGACQACMVNLRTARKLSCVEGPAFDLSQVILP